MIAGACDAFCWPPQSEDVVQLALVVLTIGVLLVMYWVFDRVFPGEKLEKMYQFLAVEKASTT